MSLAAIDPLIGHAEWTKAPLYVLHKGVSQTFLFPPGCPAHRAFCAHRGQGPHKHTSLFIFHDHPHVVELLITIIFILMDAASTFRFFPRIGINKIGHNIINTKGRGCFSTRIRRARGTGLVHPPSGQVP